MILRLEIQIKKYTLFLDPNELKAAEKFLKDAAESNLQEFLKTLSEVIKYGGNSPISREAACLLLKNQIFSKDPIINDGLKQQWMNFTNEYRTYIKKNVIISFKFSCTKSHFSVKKINGEIFYVKYFKFSSSIFELLMLITV